MVALAACGGGGSGAVPNSGAIAGSSTAASAAASSATLASGSKRSKSGSSETASAADSFVDSVGVNVHLGYYGTLYGQNFGAVERLLTGLGVRHVRDGVYPGKSDLCSNFSRLANDGIHGDFIVGQWMSSNDVTAWDSCTSRTADAYEGLNEWDAAHGSDQNWTQTDRDVQQRLYSTVKGNRGVTVIAPSLTSQQAYGTLGSVAATSDVGNLHGYFAARNPGTSGWGGGNQFGVYGSLSYDLAIAAQPSGSNPIYITETGYGDTSNAVYVPPATKARYTLRTLLEAWNAHVPRTYIYELVDEGGGYFGSYGLTDGNGNVKPAYTAVKNLLAHLSDPGGPVSPASLSYTLSGPSQLHHALFQKHDGSFVLALWLEMPEWDAQTNSPIAVSTQSAQLTFGNTPSKLRTTSFDDSGNVTSATVNAANAITLDIGGSPTLLDVSP
jgi:hypothetical protein